MHTLDKRWNKKARDVSYESSFMVSNTSDESRRLQKNSVRWSLETRTHIKDLAGNNFLVNLLVFSWMLFS